MEDVLDIGLLLRIAEEKAVDAISSVEATRDALNESDRTLAKNLVMALQELARSIDSYRQFSIISGSPSPWSILAERVRISIDRLEISE